jgi:hypothetical protein
MMRFVRLRHFSLGVRGRRCLKRFSFAFFLPLVLVKYAKQMEKEVDLKCISKTFPFRQIQCISSDVEVALCMQLTHAPVDTYYYITHYSVAYLLRTWQLLT